MPALLSLVCMPCTNGGAGLQCRNTRVSVTFCSATLSLLLVCVYAVSAMNVARRAERYVPARCFPVDYAVKSYVCTLDRCSGGGSGGPGPSPTCTRVTTQCYACQFRLTARLAVTSHDGTLQTDAVGVQPGTAPVFAYSDYYGVLGSAGEAASLCATTITAAYTGAPDASGGGDYPGLPCWYMPDQSDGGRFYMSLDAPPSVPMSAVIVFALMFAIMLGAMVCCYCATADPVQQRLRAMQEARARELERILEQNMRAQRWSDYVDDSGRSDPMRGMVAATNRRRQQMEAAPAPRLLTGAPPRQGAHHGDAGDVELPPVHFGGAQYHMNAYIMAQDAARRRGDGDAALAPQELTSAPAVHNPLHRRTAV